MKHQCVLHSFYCLGLDSAPKAFELASAHTVSLHLLVTRDPRSLLTLDTHNGFLFLLWPGPVPSNGSELYSFPSRTLSDSPAPSTGWAGALVGTIERATESASPSLGVRNFTFFIKQGQGVVRRQGRCLESLPTGDPGTQGPSPPFLPSGLLVCQESQHTHPGSQPCTGTRTKSSSLQRWSLQAFIRGGSFSSFPPFHICSLTSSAPSWERTECLSRGGGTGSRQSQETQLWGWLAARSMASSPLLHRAAESRACHPLGTDKQETDTNLALAPLPRSSRLPTGPRPSCLSLSPESPDKGHQSYINQQNQVKRSGFLGGGSGGGH